MGSQPPLQGHAAAPLQQHSHHLSLHLLVTAPQRASSRALTQAARTREVALGERGHLRYRQDLARIRRSLLDDMSSSPATEEAGRQSPPTKSMMTTTMEYNQHMEQNRAWGPIHCQFDTMGGFAVVWPHPTDGQPSQGEDGTPEGLMTLTPKGIRALAQIDQLPRITEAQIVDKSKKESIGKAIVCIRVVWAVAQVLSRLAAKLPVTLLELSTIGHIAHAIVMYTLWWYKPYNIMEPMTIPWDQGMMDFLNNEHVKEHIPNLPTEQTEGVELFKVLLAAGTILCGGMGAAAWHAYFPSLVERYLWIASSLILMSFGSVTLTYYALKMVYGVRPRPPTSRKTPETMLAAFKIVAACFYIASRRFLILEAFISVRLLPRAAYVLPDWTGYVPHL
ncbi:hypothetical protein PG996_006613 [Apiospora saccharicola]|uniref:Uncharacterized protein n=1 Tax=Apiospora saccharicola TaxID=335842 RepID=A0ABR1V8I7_9PEZI